MTPGRGVKINHIYYWSTSFQVPGLENQQVPVRYDPFDAGSAYAFVERAVGTMSFGILRHPS